MLCPKCNATLPDNAAFCEYCGTQFAAPPQPAQQPAPPVQQPVQQYQQPQPAPQYQQPVQQGGGRQISRNIVLGPDGKYRWVYELSLFKNPTILLLILKIFFFIILGIFAFITLVELINGDLDGDAILGNLKVFGIILGVMVALSLISYLIYAAMVGGKYCVLFEMDERGVLHKQLAKQYKKMQVLGMLTAMMGVASGNLAMTGVGINVASNSEMYSQFDKVRKVKASKSRNLIKVNGLLYHNQVYAETEDFDFVYDFIRSRVPLK